MLRAGQCGFTLPAVPGLREWTRPSFISWRAREQVVALPRWEELSPSQRELLRDMAGSEAEAPQLFALLFRWFLVPHELTHALQDAAGKAIDHARSERTANTLAVAFWMEQPEGPARLAALEQVLTRALTRLPDPVPAGSDSNDYFNANYDAFPTRQREYAFFQLRFILDSLRSREQLRFEQVVAELKR